METKLFVYGTLAPGELNERILKPLQGTWTPATITGTLFPNGWGVTIIYPGLIPHDDGEIINGFVFESADLPDNWQMVDDFEGKGYQRTPVQAVKENGDVVQVYVYALKDKPSSLG